MHQLLIYLFFLTLFYSSNSPRTVQVFQLTCWPLGHKVPTSTNSLVELMNMVERWRQKALGPVCIVSPDGRSRAGVYCAANACIE